MIPCVGCRRDPELPHPCRRNQCNILTISYTQPNRVSIAAFHSHVSAYGWHMEDARYIQMDIEVWRKLTRRVSPRSLSYASNACRLQAKRTSAGRCATRPVGAGIGRRREVVPLHRIPHKKFTQITLGRVGAMRLDDARKAVQKLHGELAQGVDVGAAHKAKRDAPRRRNSASKRLSGSSPSRRDDPAL